MNRTKKNGVIYLQDPTWGAIPELKHGFFSRVGGVSPPPYSTLNTGPFTGDQPKNIQENLRRIASVFSTSPDHIVCSAQVHGTRIHRVADSAVQGSPYSSGHPREGDGLITRKRGLLLGILTADCIPVLFYDPQRPAVGAGHAGWKGTLKGISGKILSRMQEAFGTRPEEVRVLLGPAIAPCCYPVGREVASAFLNESAGYEPYVTLSGPGTWKIHLAGMNRYQLTRRGVRDAHIVSSRVCTSCQRNLFFSVRAQGEPTGRQISLIGLAEPGEV